MCLTNARAYSKKLSIILVEEPYTAKRHPEARGVAVRSNYRGSETKRVPTDHQGALSFLQW